jgi:hypothetical protein
MHYAYHITLIIRTSNVRLIPFNVLIMRALLVFLTREVMKGICYFYFFTSYYNTIDIQQLRPPTIFTWDQIPHSSPTYQARHPQTHEYYLDLFKHKRSHSTVCRFQHNNVASTKRMQCTRTPIVVRQEANNNNAVFGGEGENSGTF